MFMFENEAPKIQYVWNLCNNRSGRV